MDIYFDIFTYLLLKYSIVALTFTVSLCIEGIYSKKEL